MIKADRRCLVRIIMGYKIDKTGKPPYIRIKYLDLVTSRDIIDALNEALALSKVNDLYRVLADCSRVTVGHTVVDLYAVVAALVANNVPRAEFKEAVLLPRNEASDKDVQFYETAALNRGYAVRLFKTKDEAVEWLTA